MPLQSYNLSSKFPNSTYRILYSTSLNIYSKSQNNNSKSQNINSTSWNKELNRMRERIISDERKKLL